MAFVLFNLAAVAALVGIDQLIKLWAVQALQPVGAMPFIPHVVELRFVLNQGMAFSLLSGKQLFLIIATSAALLAVAYGLFFRSRGKRLQQAALVLVLGGGIGNLIDRVLNGEVVDYINLLFMRFAVFNFALRQSQDHICRASPSHTRQPFLPASSCPSACTLCGSFHSCHRAFQPSRQNNSVCNFLDSLSSCNSPP